MPILNQKGIAPLVIILILTITAVGTYGVYKSSNIINIRADKTTETKGGNLYAKTPPPHQVTLSESGQLANKAVEVKVDEKSTDAPKFSIKPPAGWESLPANANIVIEFLSPVKDKVEGDLVYFDVQPNITVFVAKGEYENVDQADAANSKGDEAGGGKKTTIGGQEALVTISTKDVSSLLKDTLESQFKQELSKAGTKFSEDDLKSDIEEILKKAKVKIISYAFYKDGYYINVSGKALESLWWKRESQLKKSMDTFKFE